MTRFIWMLGLVLVLTACDGLATASEGDDEATAMPVIVNSTPEEVAMTFLDAWATSDFEAMYSVVSNRSREIYPQQVLKIAILSHTVRFALKPLPIR